MTHIDNMLVVRGTVGTEAIVEALTSDKYKVAVFSFADQPIQMLHYAIHVDARKHKLSKLSKFMAYMDICMDEILEGDKHYDYLIVHTQMPEENIIEAMREWLEECDKTGELDAVDQVVITCI